MSTASPARVAANRKNAERSTGPKTAEGKAASRANSLKHGVTGAGIVVPPDDLSRIAAVADDLRARFNPTDPIGLALVERAANLFIRLERCGKHENAIVAESVWTALFDFDQDRLDLADDLFAGLADNPEALSELKSFPEGVDRLIAEWSALAAIDEWSTEDLDRVARLSNANLDNPGLVFDSIPDEVRRLQSIKAAIDPRPRDLARQQAADLALFPTTPEAILARKYDAATDRALDRTMTLLKKGVKLAESVASEPASAPKIPQVATAAAGLASFSPPPAPTVVPTTLPKPEFVPIILNRPVDRSKRPDPAKLLKAQKRKRR